MKVTKENSSISYNCYSQTYDINDVGEYMLAAERQNITILEFPKLFRIGGKNYPVDTIRFSNCPERFPKLKKVKFPKETSYASARDVLKLYGIEVEIY